MPQVTLGIMLANGLQKVHPKHTFNLNIINFGMKPMMLQAHLYLGDLAALQYEGALVKGGGGLPSDVPQWTGRTAPLTTSKRISDGRV